MTLKDRILNFQRYALTNSVSVYNEDGMTAQQLAIKSANKIKECMLAISDLAEAIENIEKFLKINYASESEELTLTIEQKVQEIKSQVNTCYVNIFNENAMTSLELAGQTAKSVNECLKVVNMLSDLVLEISDNVITYDLSTETLTIGGEENE